MPGSVLRSVRPLLQPLLALGLGCSPAHARPELAIPQGLALETPAHYGFGAAAAPDGSIWFAEFNHQQLRRYDPRTGRVEVRLAGLPGMYGLAVAEGGEVFIGQDLGDADNPGRVVRVDPDSGKWETIVQGITRPRQLALGPASDLYVVCEAGSVHAGPSPSLLRWRRGSDQVEVVWDGLRTPQGVAVASDGTVYVSEYGVQGREPGRVLARSPDGATRMLAADLWQARGIALGADGVLYVLTEANQADQGNSGSLVRIDTASGERVTLLEALDYPQFPCVGADGLVYFILNRDSWLGSYGTERAYTPQPWPSAPGVLVATVGGRFEPQASGDFRLAVGPVHLQGALVAQPGSRRVQGWVRVPAERLDLSRTELYTNRGDPEHPQPGLFELPWVHAAAPAGSTFAVALAVRGHVGPRYPQTRAGTADEAPAPGFSESPVAYLTYFEWAAP